MTLVETIARPLLAGMFVYGGIDALRHPANKVPAADAVLDPASEASGVGQPDLVRINGGVQVVAGVALAAGILPRPAAAVLAVTLVPTTWAAHRFWTQQDEQEKQQQTIHFLKNAAMLGGLLLAATSTGGRPSLPWRAKRAAHHLAESASGALEHVRPAS